MKEYKKLHDLKLLDLYMNCPQYYNFFMDNPSRFKQDIINDYLRKALYTVALNIQNGINNIDYDIKTKFPNLSTNQKKIISQFQRKLIRKHKDDEFHIIGLDYPIVIGQTPFKLRYDLIIRNKFKGKFYYYHFNFNDNRHRMESSFTSVGLISAIKQLTVKENIPLDMIEINTFNFNLTPHFQTIKVKQDWINDEFNHLLNIEKGMRLGIIYRREGKHCKNCVFRNDC